MSERMSFIGFSIKEGNWDVMLAPEALDSVPKSQREGMLKLCEVFIHQMQEISSLERNVEQTRQALKSVVENLEHIVEHRAKKRLPADSSLT